MCYVPMSSTAKVLCYTVFYIHHILTLLLKVTHQNAHKCMALITTFVTGLYFSVALYYYVCMYIHTYVRTG